MEARIDYNGKMLVASHASHAEQDGLVLTPEVKEFDRLSLTEHWATITNRSSEPIQLDRVDSLIFDVSDADWELVYFTSGWGREFELVREPLRGETIMRNGTGRSSNGLHPWFALVRADEVICCSIMWSGNWVVRIEPLEGGGHRVSAGLDDQFFSKELQPGQEMESPHVALAYGTDPLFNDTSRAFAEAGRAVWYPEKVWAKFPPLEWNHWWSYEDQLINEALFKANVDAAATLGFDLCTLDAGWFGPSQPGTHWFDYRGDWDEVNAVRFPSGLRALSDYTHSKGLKFGLWCEIEALGKEARLGRERPSLPATRNGEALGYICFGNPDAREWAHEMLSRLITEYDCDWIKLDFNLDPGAGCNRTDHGHGPGDGLYEHYEGYYEVLERIRAAYPHVMLENCSSGGLRVDLGMMRHTHVTFLSDPDWPEHSLQLFWGATTMLSPDVCLRWTDSEWLGDHPEQRFDPHDPGLTEHQLDYRVRIAMLSAPGFSQKLPDLPDWISGRYQHHFTIYDTLIQRFVTLADLYRLTEQPRRGGLGARLTGFEYRMPDDSEHLVFIFRLPGEEASSTLFLRDLSPDRLYTLTWSDEGRVEHKTGRELMEEGLEAAGLREEESRIVHLT